MAYKRLVNVTNEKYILMIGDKMITLEEYRKELNLMEQQYGAEEELYPYIYMLLREAGYTQKYSMRSVAGARNDKKNTGINKKFFMGYAAFPDIVILDKEFTGKDDKDENIKPEINKLYCCVEAKRIERKEGKITPLLELEGGIQIKSGSTVRISNTGEKPPHRYYTEFDFDDFKGKKFKIKKTKNKEDRFSYDILDLIKENDKQVYIGHNYTISIEGEKFIISTKGKTGKFEIDTQAKWCYVSSKKTPTSLADILEQDEFYVSIDEWRAIACIEKNSNKTYIEMTDEHSAAHDCGELIGELLWYGRVIYTNGYEWKYLEVEDFDSLSKYRKDLFQIDEGTEINAKTGCQRHSWWCNKFSAETIKVKETPLINIGPETTESDWEDFKATLRYISKDWNK